MAAQPESCPCDDEAAPQARLRSVDRHAPPDTPPPREASPKPGGDLPASTANALVHFYRGELGRLTAYRARLDTSTN